MEGTKIECSWEEEVPEGTGKGGGNTETYCQTCTESASGVDCDPKELQFRPPPMTNLPTLQQVPTTPLFGQNIPQDLQTLTEIPPTPLPPPPTGPLTTPEDDENVADENGDEEDGTPPQGGGVRPPLRDNLPELKEEPEDEEPEQDEEPSNEGKGDSSEGAETAGPLT
jgi:hypothetical protein